MFTFFLLFAYGQAEREEKTPTPEVSNYTLTPDNNPNAGWPLDAVTVNSLRRRKVLTNSNSCNSYTPGANGSTSASTSGTCNSYTPVIPEPKAAKPRKLTYPKVTGSYPRILPNNKIHPKDVRRVKKIDGRYVKPPSSEPPVFLKCTVKKKPVDQRETSADESDESNEIESETTDLDIQFSKGNITEFLSKPDSLPENETLPANEGNGQTLKQYCNFEEKKVMRVAPHIRRKDLICDTVDAWSSNDGSSQRGPSCELSRYKPLVFGGTYPIDLPVRPGNESNAEYLKNIAGGKCISKTYDIDVPTSCE